MTVRGAIARIEGPEALAALVELVPDAMVVVAARDGRIVTVNGEAERLFGYQRGELTAQPVERLLPERFRASHARRRAGYVADPHRRPMGTGLELWGRRRNGSEFPVDISLGPIDSDQGLLVTATIRDVTERQRAEATRARLAAIVESSDDAIIAKDPDGTILSWNQGAERIYGYRPDEVVGRPVSILAPPDREDEIPRLLAAVARGERVDHYETVRLRKDGALIDVSVTISPTRDKAGMIIGASTITRDVTERKRLEALRGEFITNAAHELRTPLATVAALAEVLASHFREMTPQQIDQSLDALQRQGQRAATLVANLLDLSQLERGTTRLTLEPLDLAGAIGPVLEVAPPPHGTTVTTMLDPGQRIVADPSPLGQVLTNLLTNAYRYGGREISIAAEEHQGWVTVAVTDDGPGVTAEFAADLFDPFTRAVNTHHPLGSGIGLAICRRLVEMMGGRIWYEPARPGARFAFRLPAAAPPR